VLSTLVVYTGGGLVRELYRGFVRTSPLGRDDNPSALMGMSHSPTPDAVIVVDTSYRPISRFILAPASVHG
jgi:hypothetical protein